jgi:hypothetical protein
MQEFLSRFSYQPAKLTWELWGIVAFIWLVVMGCAVSSIRTQPFSEARRNFWVVIVVAFPIFGLLAYLPFAVRREELPTAFVLRNDAKNRKKREAKALAAGATESRRRRSSARSV